MTMPLPRTASAQCCPLTVGSCTRMSADADDPTTSRASSPKIARRAPASSCTSTNQAPVQGGTWISRVVEEESGSPCGVDMWPPKSAAMPSHRREPPECCVAAPGSADGDAERLAQPEVLLADREDEELLHLLRRRQVARKLWLGRDDLLRDLEVGAEQKSR